MADQNQGVPQDRLNDLLGLLAGAGGATGGAAMKSILLAAPQFKRLQQINPNQAMHPAVAENMGWKGALNHPIAMAEQRRLDNYVLNNYDKIVDTYNSKVPSTYGWQLGQHMGVSREVPDSDLKLWNEGQYTHPAGDLLSLFGANNRIRYKPSEEMSVPGALGSYDAQIGPMAFMNKINKPRLTLNNDLRDTKEFIDKYGNPIPRYSEAMTAHEMQHGAQVDHFPYFHMGLPYSLRPHEIEATGVENRALYPNAYKHPFWDTSKIMDRDTFAKYFGNGQ